MNNNEQYNGTINMTEAQYAALWNEGYNAWYVDECEWNAESEEGKAWLEGYYESHR